MIRRVAVFGFLAVSGFMTLGCSDGPIASPVEPQIAQKGKPPPTPTPVGSKLEEFWVVPGANSTDPNVPDAPDVLHIAWSGGGTAVDPAVVWDYFFNGIRDDDAPVDDHYEYEMPGPPLTLETKDPLLPIGWHHADMPFDGTRRDGVHPYPDFLATEVTGEGDPFAFRLTFYDDAGTTVVGRAVPFGVVVGGENVFGAMLPETTVSSEIPDHDRGIPVRSYATFSGLDPTGTISITELSMTSLKCKVRTVTVDGVRTKQTWVSGDVTLTFTKDAPITLEYGENIWWEGRFLDETPFLDEETPAISTRLHLGGSGTRSIGLTMPPGWTGGLVSFVIDYVVSNANTRTDPIDLEASLYVYDPSKNATYDPNNATGVRTTAGFLGDLWKGETDNSEVNKGKFPVAHTQVFPLNCG